MQKFSLSNSEDSSELERLLAHPKKKSEEWQSQTAKLTAIEHNNSLRSETSDHEYFRSLALCKWAQTAGVTDAKKKNLQATRFRTQIPPALEFLKIPQLVNAAIALLVNLRGAWCLEYISCEVAQPYIDKKGLSQLGEWAMKSSSSPEEFLATLLGKESKVEIEDKRMLLLIKEASSKVIYSKDASTETVAQQVLEAVQFTIQKISVVRSKNVNSELLKFLKVLLKEACSSYPAVLVQGHYLQALCLLRDSPETTKTANAILNEQINPTLKVLEEVCSLGGQDGVQFGKLLLPVLQKTYPTFDKVFSEYEKNNSILLKLKDKDEAGHEINLEDSATSLYARLLPSWNDYLSSQTNQSALGSINSDLLAAAKLNGIEFLGVTDDIVPFDPVSQKLRNESATGHANVRIVRPAVIFRRANGTYRIILPAIVDFI